MLKQGAVCNQVVALQFALNRVTEFLPKLVCDGIFGPLTLKRVMDHQKRQGLRTDGIVGPLTLDTLFERAQLTGRARFQRSRRRVLAAPLTPLGRAALGVARLNAAPAVIRTPALVGAPGTPGLRRPDPDLAVWLNPALAELARQQAAFRAWWDRPFPKPPLPELKPVNPWFQPDWSGLLGPVTPPVPRQPVVIAAVPPQPLARRQLPVTEEGREYTITLKTAANHQIDPKKSKFDGVEVEFALEWPMLKNRVKGLTIGASLSAETDGEAVGYTGKGTVALTAGSLKLGERGVLEAITELSLAAMWEGRAAGLEGEVTHKIQLDLQVTGRPEKPGLHLVLGLGPGATVTAPIVTFGPARDPEDHHLRATPFLKGSIGLEYEF
ncbi:peptidoglycan-binding protein [Azospirillum sp. RWY-5-1]|uniref:Peptidoglycan-binding protein n=1 Tax=Azospirillum oleiclasticum TaxID=2735135 RepID=A0ABX2T598_9PROT|nr:peptidoglycan-binding domain-containing protein [Azospirillum oleiclasticum]NYZ10917.1 peptidoglycan-binding protein [Azospirillum oleiclasticum]NYZ18079.1 peptidoglycan-binding protein [Azospirillum oleiclasticum]